MTRISFMADNEKLCTDFEGGRVKAESLIGKDVFERD